ncbi:nucleotide exchange factor GrpE [Kovacikia minuta CCNUW1]|uniref:nucleotide exchange factor GrpE n=1 Tax=Kovacikia minuta TaxID=2931930 RepID=UPI001CCEECB7|nr:nucleotide exchange factor GrpE [Kovacikia minuta]UBF25317.1 nucleotide exchange factor GrpE [Kovacikia minuta CCNUW1]
MSEDYTPSLQQFMQRVGFSSFRALSQAAQVSEKQVRQLRRGEIAQMRLETLFKLSQALQVSVTDLLITFSELSTQPSAPSPQPSAHLQELADLKQEYKRLQDSLVQQKQEIWQEFQQSSLQILESLLLQLPTAAYAAQQNTQAPAVKLLPLLKPFDRLLQEWGVEQIAPVGAEVPYDPQLHQLMEGSADVGDRVRIRYTGYRQGDRLLYRAKVSPVAH